MTSYDPARVVADLRELATRTGGPEGSRRLAWTPDWLQARAFFRESLATLPVEVDEDEAGNLWAVLRGERPDTLLVGSHLDSVPKGGWLDGALGVMSGLELLRAWPRDGTPPITVAVVDWADEEGARFSRSLFGSAACMGTLDIEVLRGLTDKEGGKLPEILAEHGVDIDNLDGARTRMADVKAYVEVHIEQGPILEEQGLGIATVTGTKGIERERLIFRGQAAHAGTMPMAMRRDSFRAAARFALAIAEIGERHDGVTTVGQAQCWPGVVTAVAGETRITMDMRHISAASAAGDVRRGTRRRRCRRRGGGLHDRVGAHLPHPAHAVPHPAARGRTPVGGRGRGPRLRTAERRVARRQRGRTRDPDRHDLLVVHQRPQPHEGGGHAGGAPADGRRCLPPHLRTGHRPGDGRRAVTPSNFPGSSHAAPRRPHASSAHDVDR